MMPLTRNRLPALGVLSALQKFIRRGMEKEAMECAVELIHTSKAYASMTFKRLEVIAHEDIGTGNPVAVIFTHVAMAQAREWYTPDVTKLGKVRMAVGNSIMVMCRGAKSREADHLNAVAGWGALIEGRVPDWAAAPGDDPPDLPDWIYDQHTSRGKKAGRGLDYFREVSTLLVQPDEHEAAPDPYRDEAFRLWALKAGGAPIKGPLTGDE